MIEFIGLNDLLIILNEVFEQSDSPGLTDLVWMNCLISLDDLMISLDDYFLLISPDNLMSGLNELLISLDDLSDAPG